MRGVGPQRFRTTRENRSTAMLRPESEVRRVTGISEEETMAIKNFMQGAVYSWVKNRRDEAFAVHDLMGGENFHWHGTPLMALYDKHASAGKDDAAANEAAGRDLGWLVKAVLSADKRTFEASHNGYVNSYRWVGNEP
jgi:hypothetical protein